MLSRTRFLTLSAIIIGTMVILILGCQNLKDIFVKKPERGTKFNHQQHINVTDCETCHNKFKESASAGMPDLETCLTACHEDKKEMITKESFKEGNPLWARFCVIQDEVVFSHKTHFDKKVDCTECHIGIKENTRVSQTLVPVMEACIKCHNEKVQDKSCSVCHKQIRPDSPPDNHKLNWDVLHGQIARKGADEIKKFRCDLCHRESGGETKIGCTECHRDQKPQDHTAYWRHRGHGISAGIDRTRCETCHRVDYCDRCHRQTEPRNHIASWGATQNRHCATCHLPATGENCSVCHKSITHPDATQKPNNITHNTATNCRACHTVISHIDNGDTCNNCHK